MRFTAPFPYACLYAFGGVALPSPQEHNSFGHAASTIFSIDSTKSSIASSNFSVANTKFNITVLGSPVLSLVMPALHLVLRLLNLRFGGPAGR